MENFSLAKDKILFTPGPLTTSLTIKQAMLRDLGSRDYEFIAVVKEIRNELLALAETEKGIYEAIIMQGSGTFGIESVISSVIPKEGKLLVIVNGAYGHRIVKIAQLLQIKVVKIEFNEDEVPDIEKIENYLKNDNEITTVAAVHCETTTGIINPAKEMSEVAKKHNKVFILDAMSSFGAYKIPIEKWGIDYLISSANKCIEGVPGFAFILARREELLKIEGNQRSLSLDILAQWKGLEEIGQFRFTPPIQSILAFRQALRELEIEGGIEGRSERYINNHKVLVEGMSALGFKVYLQNKFQSYIITSFLYPDHPYFRFNEFYERLNKKDFVIYPGKLSKVDCFRIGNIGRIFEADILNLLSAIKETLSEMKIII